MKTCSDLFVSIRNYLDRWLTSIRAEEAFVSLFNQVLTVVNLSVV